MREGYHNPNQTFAVEVTVVYCGANQVFGELMKPLPLPVRLVVTWLAIFPLVALAQYLLTPMVADWPHMLATGLTMALVVPVAILVTMPLLSRWTARLLARPAVSAPAKGQA